MCRAGGRRCPSHSDPKLVAERNRQRREAYKHAQTSAVDVDSLFKPFTESREAVEPGTESYQKFSRAGRTFNKRITDEERQHIREYTKMGFREVRDYLNGHPLHSEDEEYDVSDETRKNLDTQIEHLDSALAKAPKPREPRTLYRGMVSPWSANEDVVGWVSEKFPIGSVVNHASYMSTSLHMQVAKKFTGITEGRGFIMEIVSSSGAALNYETSDYGESEREILLPRNSSFKVVSITPDVEINYDDLLFRKIRKRTATMTVIRLVDTSIAGED